MPTTYLPPTDNVVRFVKNRLLRRDSDDNVIGVLPGAFELREDETYLSVTWIEYFAGSAEERLEAAVRAVKEQLTVKPKDGFALAGVARLTEIAETVSVRIRITHEPLPKNNGHSGIRGLPRDHVDLLARLADEACHDTRIAGTFP